LVELLIDHPKVDPCDCNNDAIASAVSQNQIQVVKRLLLDPRINPGDNGNESLCYAFNTKSLELINLLLQDNRIDISKTNLSYITIDLKQFSDSIAQSIDPSTAAQQKEQHKE
jgi:hypothetical protein